MVHKSYRKSIVCKILLLLIFSLSSCSISDTSETEKDLADYTTAEHMLDGIDAAYDTDYSKITLPERETLHITQPEGVYELTLEVINADGNKEWENQKNKELAAVFDTSGGAEACVVVSGAYYINEKLLQNSASPVNNDPALECEITTLSPLTHKSLDTKLIQVTDNAENYASKVKEITGEELDTYVYDVLEYKCENKTGYGVEMQKSYKGIGVLNMYPLHPTAEQLSETHSLKVLQTYSDFNDDAEVVFYAAPPSYKTANAQAIDKVVSFKGACDILEEKLSENSHYEFDDVVLMYEPYTDLTKGDLADIECVPKWYFIIYTRSSGENMIRYFSVSLKDGAVEAVI